MADIVEPVALATAATDAGKFFFPNFSLCAEVSFKLTKFASDE